MTQPVEIEIFGKKYQVRGDKDEKATREIAAYVDEQMRAVADHSHPTATPLQISVLTLLRIANDLFESRGELVQSESATREKAASLIELIDSSLSESR